MLAACGNSPTTPTTATTTATATTELFAGSLSPGSASFYSFNVSQAGTVHETLVSVTDSGGAAIDGITLSLGFGVPSGKGCARSTEVTTGATLLAQLASDAAPGTYCADVADTIPFSTTRRFVVRIVHP
jgi:hypothetical protein